LREIRPLKKKTLKSCPIYGAIAPKLLNGVALSLKRGRKVRFLREIHPCKRRTPKSGANIGAITGILLIFVSKKAVVLMALVRCNESNDNCYFPHIE
jgi:hypothetical protein